MASTDPESEPGGDVRQTLEHADKLAVLGRVVPGIAHELNNPLAAIMAFNEILRQDPRVPDDLRADVQLVIGETARVRRLATAVFDFARLRPPERVRTSVSALVAASSALVEPSLRDGRVILEATVSTDVPDVLVDRARVQHLLVALTLQAVDTILGSGGSGRVRVHAATVAGTVAIAVEAIPAGGAGAGAPPVARGEKRTRQLPETPPAPHAARAIAEAHGGSVAVEAASSHGYTFTLSLPTADATDRAARDSVAATGRTAEPPTRASVGAPTHDEADRRPRILVLDDEPSIRTFLVKALAAQGWLGVAAASGAEALHLVEEGPFAAAMCDHRMPGGSGPQFVMALQQAHPELARRVVLMSGDAFDPDLRSFAAEHGLPVLPKPFDVRAVGAAVREALERA